MTTPRDQYEPYYRKAAQSWLGAQSELAAERFDNAIALAYYACFQLAVARLTRDGAPPDRRGGFSHGSAIDEIDRVISSAGQTSLEGKIRDIYAGRLDAQYRSTGHIHLKASELLENAASIMEILQVGLEPTSNAPTSEESSDGDSGEAD